MFEELLEDADTIIDGYRPDVLERLVYGPPPVQSRLLPRKRSFVCLSEVHLMPVGLQTEQSV